MGGDGDPDEGSQNGGGGRVRESLVSSHHCSTSEVIEISRYQPVFKSQLISRRTSPVTS